MKMIKLAMVVVAMACALGGVAKAAVIFQALTHVAGVK